ncbi:MAG: metallophosphoesterase, partial [Bacteroidota bacterium]
MKTSQYIMFFAIVLTVQILVNTYLTVRGYQALEAHPKLRVWFIIFMVVATFSYIAGRTLEKSMYNPLTVSLHWLGAFWFAVMLYATLQVLLIDLARLADLAFPFIHKIAGPDYPRFKFIVGTAVAGITLIVVLGGHINAWYPKKAELTLDIPKEANGMEELRIVNVSDVHLGTIIGPRKTAKLVNTINEMNPDIILMAGDVLDEDVGPVIRQNLGECLRKLDAPLGV